MSGRVSADLAGRGAPSSEEIGPGANSSNALRAGCRAVGGDRRCVCGGRVDFAARTFANCFRRYFSVSAAAARECVAAGERWDALSPHEFILDFDGRELRALATVLVVRAGRGADGTLRCLALNFG